MLFCPKQVFCKCVTHCENGKFRSTMADIRWFRSALRSEEHTSELQSPCNLVCRLLLEKKKIQTHRAEVLSSTPSLRPRCTSALLVDLLPTLCRPRPLSSPERVLREIPHHSYVSCSREL